MERLRWCCRRVLSPPTRPHFPSNSNVVSRKRKLPKVVKWDLTVRLTALALLAIALHAQTPGEVLVVVNKRSPDSREIGEYYLKKRAIPLANLCAIDTPPIEAITREVYDRQIRAPVGEFLQKH